MAETKNFGVAPEWFDALKPCRNTIYIIKMANKRKAKQLEKGQDKKGKSEGILKSAKAQKQKGTMHLDYSLWSCVVRLGTRVPGLTPFPTTTSLSYS